METIAFRTVSYGLGFWVETLPQLIIGRVIAFTEIWEKFFEHFSERFVFKVHLIEFGDSMQALSTEGFAQYFDFSFEKMNFPRADILRHRTPRERRLAIPVRELKLTQSGPERCESFKNRRMAIVKNDAEARGA